MSENKGNSNQKKEEINNKESSFSTRKLPLSPPEQNVVRRTLYE
jgi:hypothetical protein